MLTIMKYFEPTYLIVLSVSIIDWLFTSVNSITALVIGILTAAYMFFKAYNEYLTWKEKKKNK